MKFGFPMAWSTTTTAWGIWAFSDAFESAGEMTNALNSIKFPLDYFLKCILRNDDNSVRAFVGQVSPYFLINHCMLVGTTFWSSIISYNPLSPGHFLDKV